MGLLSFQKKKKYDRIHERLSEKAETSEEVRNLLFGQSHTKMIQEVPEMQQRRAKKKLRKWLEKNNPFN
ncbi:hypothetical protein IMZ31_21575 (plasmid) [Pontibacillus sp. ALD_SL1]|uniref:hypothetical protein n=1 Tax=Pontibacillus sp. ALD_SL1 TaxID=2777185 RepID=UPI001A9781B8|nr:hypothetical protein [Pontibacillus sp. ALD_SL1]QST02043.1 hypothetical protein IMZ31_21575 [Pontibacillus sp. ALD_SL1]